MHADQATLPERPQPRPSTDPPPALAELLGKDFVTVYREIKEIEFAEFMKVISPWEREHLLLHV